MRYDPLPGFDPAPAHLRRCRPPATWTRIEQWLYFHVLFFLSSTAVTAPRLSLEEADQAIRAQQDKRREFVAGFSAATREELSKSLQRVAAIEKELAKSKSGSERNFLVPHARVTELPI